MAVITNHYTGWLFTLDATNMYHRGRASWILLTMLTVDVVILFLNYLMHRRYIEATFRTIMHTLPAIAIVMGLVQQLLPEAQTSGSLMFMVLLVLFINFQRSQLNQDALTGIGSRSGLFLRMQHLIHNKETFTLQMVSLRRFQQINHRYGLNTGDRLLREVAQELKDICENDHIYRFGGTDYVILHEHRSSGESTAQLIHIRERFTLPWVSGHVTTLLSASFAEISYPEGGETQEEILNGLEYCRTLSKDRTSGSLVCCDPAIRRKLSERETLQELIQQGLDQDLFYLMYQPVYDKEGSHVVAAEALLRLRAPSGAVVSPADFIPLAESSGAIISLTWLVLRKVCAFLQAHRDQELPPISINFSVQQFLEYDMVETIQQHLATYQVDPNALKVEITERMFTENDDLLESNIRQLESLGIGLYLDDFGTGYSNMEVVTRLPFEVVKVDRSLLNAERTLGSDRLLQALLIGLKQLGAQVLVEGVENFEQAQLLRSMGADRLQGFYFSRPLSEEDFLALLEKQYS